MIDESKSPEGAENQLSIQIRERHQRALRVMLTLMIDYCWQMVAWNKPDPPYLH